MSQGWQAPFRILREQFLAAAGEHFRVSLALESLPEADLGGISSDRTTGPELLRGAADLTDREPGQSVCRYATTMVRGETDGVWRFDALATEAGNSLPFDFWPAGRLFPGLSELANLDPSPVTLWSEFLFVTRHTSFRVDEGRPTRGCRVARLDGDPFLTSATAIDQFLLAPRAPNLGGYFLLMGTLCPWLTNVAGGFPMTPPGVLDSPVLRFDLVGVFRTAVELGRSLAARDALSGPPGTAGDEGAPAQFMEVLAADHAVETATDRLLCVLNPRMSHVPDWSRQLDLADASPEARQAILTLGLGVADIRGDWEGRGRELLAGGAWHLWTGMSTEDRAAVRESLAETHRLWGWPPDSGGEPGEYTGPRATLSDPRVIDPHRWRTTRAEYLNHFHATASRMNTLVDTIRLPNGGYFDIYRDDVKGTRHSVPSICARAEPKPPVGSRLEGDLLAEIEYRFHDLGLISPDESIHWVGRQDRRETRCGCELAPAGFDRPRPAEWRTLRDLKAAIVAMMKLVGTYVGGRGTGLLFPSQDRVTFDGAAERVYGLAQSLNIPLPPIVTNPSMIRVHPHGPTALPVYELAEGLVISEADGRHWLANWRAVRVGLDARLAQLDRTVQPGIEADDVDTRDHPLDAPAGTPSPLREAFESVAQALFEAADFRRQPWYGSAAFRDLARGFADRVHSADRAYAIAEIQLQAVTDADGCAHREALAAIRRVNDAIGHVVLGSVPEHMAAAHLRHVPAPDVAGLLQRMRQQVSRAAHTTAAARRLGAGSVVTAAGEARPTDSSPIDEAELTILAELSARHPILLKNVDLEAATRLSKQTVSRLITGLVGKGLVARPKGERKGATVTPEGAALVGRIRKSSADHP
jgi:DNA-binding MarR family transcriptional regulator